MSETVPSALTSFCVEGRREVSRRIEVLMPEQRTRSSTVTFNHPFRITDVNGALPPEQYIVETTEEPIDGLSFVLYRRLWTTITLPAVGAERPAQRATSKQIVTVDPKELDAALANDGRGSHGDAVA